MDRKVLGRGLDALIPTDTQGIKERVQMLNVNQVKASRFQPRLSFSQSRIEELANSIREKGVIQPVLVRSIDGENYELIAGERRLRAVKHLGLTEIPAIVRRVADADLLEMSIIENIQREELNAVEEAKAYRRLAQEFGLSQDVIAQRVGKDKSSISNLLRLLNLPQKIQDYVTQSFITFGHAKALLSLADPKNQENFADQIIQQNLSVRQTEILVNQRGLRKRSAKRNTVRNVDQDTLALEEKLQHTLGTKVRIQHGKKRGKIEIEYYSLEDLDRILALLGAK